MTRPHLLACPSCARHVRATESSCPFCGASVAEAAATFVPRQAPAQRLSRAAMYAFGVGALVVPTTGLGCHSDAVAPAYGTVAVYDGSFVEDGQADAVAEAALDAPSAVPHYGAPAHPLPDAEPDGDAEPDASEDAGADAHSTQPSYGLATDAALTADTGATDAPASDANH